MGRKRIGSLPDRARGASERLTGPGAPPGPVAVLLKVQDRTLKSGIRTGLGREQAFRSQDHPARSEFSRSTEDVTIKVSFVVWSSTTSKLQSATGRTPRSLVTLIGRADRLMVPLEGIEVFQDRQGGGSNGTGHE